MSLHFNEIMHLRYLRQEALKLPIFFKELVMAYEGLERNWCADVKYTESAMTRALEAVGLDFVVDRPTNETWRIEWDIDIDCTTIKARRYDNEFEPQDFQFNILNPRLALFSCDD